MSWSNTGLNTEQAAVTQQAMIYQHFLWRLFYLMQQCTLTLSRRTPSKHIRRKGPLKAEQRDIMSQTVRRSLQEFCSLLFVIPRCFLMLQDPWRSVFLSGSRMDPFHLLNPSTTLIYKSQQTATAYLSQLAYFLSHIRSFFYRWHWSPLWVEITTLNWTLILPDMFSVAYCNPFVSN